MNTKNLFDSTIEDIISTLLQEADVAISNLDPKMVASYKDTVLKPLASKQAVDPAKMQEAIKAGVIEDHGNNIYTVSDAALPHVNQDPELQGKFLPAQQAAADAARQQTQQPTTPDQTQQPQQAQQTQPQNPTTSRTTSKPSTNRAGVVSNVYKMQ